MLGFVAVELFLRGLSVVCGKAYAIFVALVQVTCVEGIGCQALLWFTEYTVRATRHSCAVSLDDSEELTTINHEIISTVICAILCVSIIHVSYSPTHLNIATTTKATTNAAHTAIMW